MTEQSKNPHELTEEDFVVETLGENKYESPLELPDHFWCDEDRRVIYNNTLEPDGVKNTEILSFERAGPNKMIHFDSSNINVGIVTCGGLCPGLNDVIRAVTYNCLSYKVKTIYGFRYGWEGLTKNAPHRPMVLDHDSIDNIHEMGGSILGSSRGPQSVEDMVDTLVKYNISILFPIGGDGTQHASRLLAEEITRRKLDISILGIPKTIDNDIFAIHKTFGFNTAVEGARSAINQIHIEAKGARNGIGIVKIMGRHSGSITAHATLATANVNLCLIPEIDLDIDATIEKIVDRLESAEHLVIAVAEGVGQELLWENEKKEYDISGNLKLKDIGVWLKSKIMEELDKRDIPHTMRYIDPSYMIRSIPANSTDSIFCLRLANTAVHAGMAGKTNAIIGYWNQHFTLVPIKTAISRKKTVDTNSSLWRSIMEITL